MLIDDFSEFCDNTALNTGAAGTYLVGDVMDTSNIRDLGAGKPVYVVAIVSTTATSGGSATLVLKIATDSTAAISTTTATDHIVFPSFAVADLTAGTILGIVALPVEGKTYEQFVGVLQVTGTAAFTAGAIDVFLTQDPRAHKAYADASN